MHLYQASDQAVSNADPDYVFTQCDTVVTLSKVVLQGDFHSEDAGSEMKVASVKMMPSSTISSSPIFSLKGSLGWY